MKKKSLVRVEIDSDSLLDFRKILFEQGIAAETFFSHLVRRGTTRDEAVLNLIKEAAKEKKSDLFKESNMRKKSLDANAIYAMIQEELEQEKLDNNIEESDND